MVSASSRRLLQAHLRQLYADVGVEPARGNGVQKLVVHLGGAVSLNL